VSGIKRFEDLFVLEVYKTTQQFPTDEKFKWTNKIPLKPET